MSYLPLLPHRRDLMLSRRDEDTAAAGAHLLAVHEEPRRARWGADVQLGDALPNGGEIGVSHLVAAALDVVGRRRHLLDARGELFRGLLQPAEAAIELPELAEGHGGGLERVDLRPELASTVEIEPPSSLLRLVDELLDLAGPRRRVRGRGLEGEGGGKDDGHGRYLP
ncbi:hypothetical protein [Sorangium cellulosum]|uniref:hypothetical protein n=1 Tax=Sorangium cellulosum TaxID=56 RepID=UPI0013ED0047|nr:hypothetical protein [Sorangium cellulosum]